MRVKDPSCTWAEVRSTALYRADLDVAMSTSTSTCPANDVTLRQATEDDARNMAIIKMSNTSVFSRVIDNLPEMTAGSVPEATIQAHERDIRKRLSTKNALVTVAIVPTSDNGEEIAGWAMWKISDEPQPIEEEPKPVTSEHDDEQARLAKFCLQDFKSALAKYRNIYTAGKRNVRKFVFPWIVFHTSTGVEVDQLTHFHTLLRAMQPLHSPCIP